MKYQRAKLPGLRRFIVNGGEWVFTTRTDRPLIVREHLYRRFGCDARVRIEVVR